MRHALPQHLRDNALHKSTFHIKLHYLRLFATSIDKSNREPSLDRHCSGGVHKKIQQLQLNSDLKT